ncbi:MAG TPA: CarD family transcriptional regulator, partial [Candidatus Limnocylindria bacterium]
MVSAVRVARARLGGVLELADRSVTYRELAARLEERQRLKVTDATAGARAFAWSALVAQNGRTVALIAPSEDRARRWRAELAGWLGEDRVLSFPERETMPFEASAPSGTSVHQRLLTLWRLATAQAPVAVVTSLRALLEHTIPPEELSRRGRTLRAGDRLSWAETAAWLFDLGYEPVTEVSEPGTFSRRGGIIDIYPASAEQPARVELFGDEIETLRAFDPVTQRSQSPLDELIVLPAREFALETAPSLAEKLVRAGWERLARADDEEGADLSPYAKLVDALREGGYAPGVDAFAPALGATASLLDHLGGRATVVFEDTVELDLAHDALEAQAEERRGELADQGLPVAVFPPPYVPRSRIESLAAEHGSARMGTGTDAVRLGWGGTTSYAGRLNDFIGQLATTRGEGITLIATPQAARLSELLADRDVTAVARETVEEIPESGSLVVARVPLAEGFAITELGLRVFTDAEVFGFRKPRHPEQRRRRVQIGSFLSDLKPGDHIVHEDHGIGRFERFITREIAGVVREYLELQFAGTDVVSLPTERVDKVT